MITETVATAKPKRGLKWIGMLLKDKGGTGASVVARFLAELHEQRKTGAYLVDGDGTTASLSKHFGLPRENADPSLANPENPVHAFSLHGTERDRDAFANLLELDEAKVLVDLPATSLTVIKKIDQEYAWTSLLAQHGWRPTIISCITPFEESVFDLDDVMELFGKRADYVAVVNLGANAEDRSDFAIWDHGEIKKRFVLAGGTEIEFPRLKPGILAKLQMSPKLTFAAGKGDGRLSVIDRSRLAIWYAAAEASLKPAQAYLGF